MIRYQVWITTKKLGPMNHVEDILAKDIVHARAQLYGKMKKYEVATLYTQNSEKSVGALYYGNGEIWWLSMRSREYHLVKSNGSLGKKRD